MANRTRSYFVAMLGLICAITIYEASEFVCPETSGQFPDPTNCRNYYLCWEDNATAQECPSNMLFDVNQAICTLTDDVNCASRQDPDNKQNYTCASPYGLFPNEEDDTSYYYCTDGIPAYMTCPCGTKFDIDQNAQCVPIEERYN